MQLEFTAALSFFKPGYEWYDSDDYSMLLVGAPGKMRPKTRAAQRRFRCAGDVEDIPKENFVQFDPFKTCSSMFLEFSELDGSEEAILAFTNRYGTLWSDLSGPSLADYHDAIEDLRDAVELWRAVQSEDTQQLGRYAAWDSAGRLRWKSVLAKPIQFRGETIHFVDVKYGPRKYKRGDLQTPVTDLLDFVIHTRPSWGTIKPARINGRMSLQLEVDDLLSVLWVQFAVAVAEDKSFARCQFCNRPFELAPQINRADRVFCSDNCRVKAYQQRRKLAINLRQQGETPRSIAKATGTDLQTVKKWITEFEAKEKSSDEETQGKR
jgi:hypothetical protein